VSRALVEAAQLGDHEAFEALALSVADRMFGIARLVLRDVHLAEDAVQESLIRAWRELPRLEDPDRFNAWLYRILVNACADQGRVRRRWSSQLVILRSEPSTDDPQGVLADRDQLERGFRRLKPEHRVAIALHYYLGLSAPEIAETLGVPVGTAKSRLHYATETLRAVLDADARQPLAATNGQSA